MSIAHVTFEDAKNRFDFHYDKATSAPTAVQPNGVAHVVMLPAVEFERLACLDRIAMSPEELSDETLGSLETAQPRPEAIALNNLLANSHTAPSSLFRTAVAK